MPGSWGGNYDDAAVAPPVSSPDVILHARLIACHERVERFVCVNSQAEAFPSVNDALQQAQQAAPGEGDCAAPGRQARLGG